MNSRFLTIVFFVLALGGAIFCGWSYLRWFEQVNAWGNQPLNSQTWLHPNNVNLARVEINYFILGNTVAASSTKDQYYTLAVRDDDAPADSPATLPINLPRSARTQALIKTTSGLSVAISPLNISGEIANHLGQVRLSFSKVLSGDSSGFEYSELINLVK